MTTKYNGWTNYETWLVNLWIDNDEGSQRFWQLLRRATDALESNEEDPNGAESDLADALKESFEDQAEAMTEVTGFWADLINSALGEVNWDEIAEHMIADAQEG